MIALNLEGLIFILLLAIIGMPVILLGIGYYLRERNKKASKVFYILAVACFLIGFGICFGGF